jgi:gluconolactonase
MKSRTVGLLASIVIAAVAANSPIPAGEKPKPLGSVGAGEGPAWDGKGNLYFSGRGRISKRDASGAVTTFKELGTNGLIFDFEGRLVACNPANRRVVRFEPDGQMTVLADRYQGMQFNSPNDVTIDSKGRIYFSDPRYGSRDNMEMKDKDGQFVEGVYRIDAPGKVTRIIGREVERANGIFISPRDQYIYVADNNNNTPGGARKLWRFTFRRDGSVDAASRKLVYDWKDGRGPDGLKMDREGRLYVAGGRNEPSKFETAEKFKGGVYILSQEGALLDFVPIPNDEVTNCAFGGPDLKTLFITAGGNLWSMQVNTPGWLPYLRK